MDLRKIKKLIELVEESGIAELEVSSGDEGVRIAMRGSVAAQTTAHMNPSGNGNNQQLPLAGAPPTTPAAKSDSVEIVTPMAGTFYQAPDPESPPYITLGQQVNAGDVVCIIESMKMMHEIRAAQGGELVEICVGNGDAVGTGTLLFKLR